MRGLVGTVITLLALAMTGGPGGAQDRGHDTYMSPPVGRAL